MITDPIIPSGFELPPLGRVYIPDPRDMKYPLGTVIAPSAKGRNWQKTGRIWFPYKGFSWKNQKLSDCTWHGVGHAHQLAPIVRKNIFDISTGCYPWSQRNDEWAGENYEGTSVRAAIEFFRQPNTLPGGPTVSGYRWARNMDEALWRLSASPEEGGGPLVLGTDWYAGCDNLQSNPPEENWWTPTGRNRGGHCYVIWGLAGKSKYVLTGNSHPGNNQARMSLDVLEYLVFQANGEAAAIQEIAK